MNLIEAVLGESGHRILHRRPHLVADDRNLVEPLWLLFKVTDVRRVGSHGITEFPEDIATPLADLELSLHVGVARPLLPCVRGAFATLLDDSEASLSRCFCRHDPS